MNKVENKVLIFGGLSCVLSGYAFSFVPMQHWPAVISFGIGLIIGYHLVGRKKE